MTNIPATEFLEIIHNGEAITIIDVRTPEEFDEGHIEGAVCIPVHTISKEILETHGITTERPVICYCLSGGRSANACIKLKSLGCTNVKNIEGGLRALQGI